MRSSDRRKIYMNKTRHRLRIFALLSSLLTVSGAVTFWTPAEAAVRLLFPVADTRVTSGFGLRVHPVTRAEDFHTGLDLAATLNQRVHTVMSGVVVQAGARGLLGNAVEVLDQSSGISTIYGHLNGLAVAAGDRVEKGETIGYAGSTGRSTGVHVHFTVKRNGVICDPTPFLDGIARNGKLIAIGPSRTSGQAIARVDPVEAKRLAAVKLAEAKEAARLAQNELAKAKEAVAVAKKDASTYSYLFDQGAVSRNDSEVRQAALRAAEGRLAAAQKKVDGLG